MAALLDQVGSLTGGPAPRLLVDAATAPLVQAELAIRDWALETQLQLVLPAAQLLDQPGDGMGWRAAAVRTEAHDVFVHPDHRGHRVATGLLGLAVGRARGRGAGPVLIGAEPGDTPKRLYAALGFRPTAVTRSWSPPR